MRAHIHPGITATCSDGVHPGQRIDRRRAAEDQHRRYDNVGGKAEEHEHEVGNGAPPSGDDLQPGVRVWGIELELRGKLFVGGVIALV